VEREPFLLGKERTEREAEIAPEENSD